MADIITAANAGSWEPADEFDLAVQQAEEFDLAIDAHLSVAGATVAEDYAEHAANRVSQHLDGTYKPTGARRPAHRRTLDLSNEPEPEQESTLSDDEALAMWEAGS